MSQENAIEWRLEKRFRPSGKKSIARLVSYVRGCFRLGYNMCGSLMVSEGGRKRRKAIENLLGEK